jgi:hypothetical protein
MAEPPKIETPKPPINWRAVLLQTLEVLGAAIVALGAGLYEPYLGLVIFGAYVVYAANVSGG